MRMPDRINWPRLIEAIKMKQAGRSLTATAREIGIPVQTLKFLLAGETPDAQVFGAIFKIIPWLGIEPRTFLIESKEV